VFDVGELVITVNPINDDPVAVDDTYSVDEDDSVVLTPLDDDTDVDGDVLSIQSINGTTFTGGEQTIAVDNGVVRIDAGGIITFTPDDDFNGSVTIPYTISDGNGGTATANQIITVNAVNDPPVAVDDSYSVDEDDSVVLTPLTGDSDIDGDGLTIESINGTLIAGGAQTIPVTNGTVTIDAGGIITFTPDANYNGPVSFPYVINDGNGATATADQLITVNSVNDDPVAVDDAYTVNEDESVILTPLTGDTDVDGDPLTVQSINGTAVTPGVAQNIAVTNGQVTIATDGTITFVPADDYNGPVTFTYTISDGQGGTATASQNINVVSTPDAYDDNFITNEDTAITDDLFADNGNGPDDLGITPTTAALETNATYG
jgi:hypothetical protein